MCPQLMDSKERRYIDMLTPNMRYAELKDSYLFNTIYRKTDEYLREIRGSIPVVRDRRPELYHI